MKLKYSFEMMDLDDHFVAVPLGEDDQGFHGVIKLNGSAASIFKLLQNDTSVETVVDALEKEYDASRETLENAVESCISALREKDLLES